jgi:hypothetical protein
VCGRSTTRAQSSLLFHEHSKADARTAACRELAEIELISHKSRQVHAT